MTFLQYVEQIAAAYEAARAVAPETRRERVIPSVANAPCVALVMPHPDDECITGALALRLQRECGARVVNIAVTLGSNVARKAARREELRVACDQLGFDLEILGADQLGLDRVTMTARAQAVDTWQEHVATLATVLSRRAPRVIVAPHENDWHPTHVGVHWLTVDALAAMKPAYTGVLVETEFWFPMATPNLAVETSPTDTAALINAIACHRGEVARNPYHLRLPAWMMDNVRRMELLGGKGTAVPDALFATLYRVRRVVNASVQAPEEGFHFVAAGDRSALATAMGLV